MDQKNNIPSRGFIGSSSIRPNDDQNRAVNNVTQLPVAPLATQEPNISLTSNLPNNLNHVGYDPQNFDTTSLFRGGRINIGLVQNAIDYINQQQIANNASAARGRASSSTTNRGPIIDNVHVLNSDTTQLSRKRSFVSPDVQAPNFMNGPHHPQPKYQALTRASHPTNVEAPYRVKENTDGGSGSGNARIEPGTGSQLPNQFVGMNQATNGNNADHEKLSCPEKLDLLLQLLREGCSNAPVVNTPVVDAPVVNSEPQICIGHATGGAGGSIIDTNTKGKEVMVSYPQENTVPAENMPTQVLPGDNDRDNDWPNGAGSPLITFAPIEEDEDYVDPQLWLRDDSPLVFSHEFLFSFPDDQEEDM